MTTRLLSALALAALAAAAGAAEPSPVSVRVDQDQAVFQAGGAVVARYHVGGAYLCVFAIDLEASGGPVTFGDTKEGSLGVRVSDQLLVKDKKVQNEKSVIRNAEGQTGEAGCWGRPSLWCDYSGEVDGKAVGVALFADPANPQPTCWHVRDYGLM